jgi:acetylornithine deacetylase
MTAMLSLSSLLLITSVIAAPQASQVLSPGTFTTTISVAPTASSTTSALASLTSEERAELFELHEELVNIPSISNDELECTEYISEYLEELGYYVEKIPVGDTSTFNVFAYPISLKDECVWPEVLITSHIDTVSGCSRLYEGACCFCVATSNVELCSARNNS